jgi:hypothetical protein
VRPTLVLSVKAAEFEKAIRAATAPETLLDTIGPDIKTAHDKGEITATEADYLRPIFNDCGKRLKSSEQQRG